VGLGGKLTGKKPVLRTIVAKKRGNLWRPKLSGCFPDSAKAISHKATAVPIACS
jgi:hypothetical protein